MTDNTFKYLGILQLIVGLLAIPAGLSLIIDPSGLTIGFSSELLVDSPFSDYTIPGWFLLIVNGILSVVGAWLSFKRHPKTAYMGIFLGIFLVLWIAIQVYIIGLIHFLQPAFFIVGLIEIFLSFSLNKHSISHRIHHL